VPTGSPLPGALALSRSLRALRRRVASRSRLMVDLERTVRRVADEQIWVPALRPARERWLDLSLIIDRSPSMGIWGPLAGELYRLLACSGAFRIVRLWAVDCRTRPPQLYSGPDRRAGQTHRHPRELIDPTGRSLILILSDCVSDAWRDGSIGRLLETWSMHGPVALVQVLPEHMWSRTALGEASLVRLTSPGPAAPNGRLAAQPASFWNGTLAGQPGTPLPVTSLEPGPLGSLAALIGVSGKSMAAGVVLDLEPPAPEPEPAIAPSPHERLGQFWQVASPTASRLAGLLAAAPVLSLPIIRLVRQAMLPGALQVHEAEVLLGGLLRDVSPRRSGALESHPDEARYDFHEGLRPLLLDLVPTAQARDVLEEVSDYVVEHLGQGRDFRAVIADPTATGGSLEADTSPFARVAAEVLLRMGGEHARLVARGGAPRTPAAAGQSVVSVAGSIRPESMVQTAASPDSDAFVRPARQPSLQKKLSRVRPPRVQITYDREVNDSLVKVELPFVIGVLAPLSGHAKEPRGPLKDRRFVEVDRDRIEDVMRELAPELRFRVADRVLGGGYQMAVLLRFRGLDDFRPDGLVRQVAPLSSLRDARQALIHLRSDADRGPRLAAWLPRGRRLDSVEVQGQSAASEPVPDPGQYNAAVALLREILEMARTREPFDEGFMVPLLEHVAAAPDFSLDLGPLVILDRMVARFDQALCDQVAEILHHPEFQKLEAAWRGLYYLVSDTETSALLKIRVLDATKSELYENLTSAPTVEDSALSRLIYDHELGDLGGRPYGLLVGDYDFSHKEEDVSLLSAIAAIAARCHAPFIAAASPALFQIESFTDLHVARDLAECFRMVGYEAWHAFRKSSQSKYVGLTLPRVLLRLPYGSDTIPVDTFPFEEIRDAPDHGQYLWGSAAWAFAARVAESFARHGWFDRFLGIERGVIRTLAVRQ
jgi:type VI secretion system protein ImpC